MYARTLAFAVLALSSVAAAAADYAPGTTITLEGTVSGFNSARSFWLNVDGAKVLVYGTNAQRLRLAAGQQVRVEGTLSDDFIKVADIELQARAIESLRGLSAAGTTAALQAP